MSLLTALLRDSLLNDVVHHDVWIAARTDGANGSGTELDPWNGANENFPGTSTKRFDYVMQNNVTSNVAIHLYPGTYVTAGYPVVAWKPKDNQRILGAGMMASVIRVAPLSEATRYVLANSSSNDFVNAFDVCEVTMDGDLPNLSPVGPNTVVGCLAVSGKRITLRRVRAINFGSKNSSVTVLGLRLGSKAGISPVPAEDCLIENCIVERASEISKVVDGGSGFAVAGVRLYGTSDANHKDCAIRDCLVDFGNVPGDPVNVGMTLAEQNVNNRGIGAAGGDGTIVEGNIVLNCANGGPAMPSSEGVSSKDLITRDNFCYHVMTGIALNLSSSDAMSRLQLIDNVIDLTTSADVVANLAAVGIKLGGPTSGSAVFSESIVRNNVIRHEENTAGPASTLGIHFDGCEKALVDNNLATVTRSDDNSIQHKNSSQFQCMNNRTSAGSLRPGYEQDTGPHDADLIAEAQETLLAF